MHFATPLQLKARCWRITQVYETYGAPTPTSRMQRWCHALNACTTSPAFTGR